MREMILKVGWLYNYIMMEEYFMREMILKVWLVI